MVRFLSVYSDGEFYPKLGRRLILIPTEELENRIRTYVWEFENLINLLSQKFTYFWVVSGRRQFYEFCYFSIQLQIQNF